MSILSRKLSSFTGASEGGEEEGKSKKKSSIPSSVSLPFSSSQSYDEQGRGSETSSVGDFSSAVRSKKSPLTVDDEQRSENSETSSKRKKKSKSKKKEKEKEEEETDGESFSKLLKLHGSGLWAIIEFGKERNQDELAYHLYQMAEATENIEPFVLGRPLAVLLLFLFRKSNFLYFSPQLFFGKKFTQSRMSNNSFEVIM